MDWVLIGEIADKFGVRYEFWKLASPDRVMYEARSKDRGHRVGLVVLCETQSIAVVSGFRRRGIASAMYNEIEIHTGQKLRPGAILTKDGQAFWEARLGTANGS
jgi:hypothetical protein